MKTYTRNQYVRRVIIAVVIGLMYALVVAILSSYGGGLVFLGFFVATPVIAALLWKRMDTLRPLKGSFLIDEHDRVIVYIHDTLFVNTKQLKQKKLRVVQHPLQDIVVDGTHSIMIADGEREITVQSTAWVEVDLSRLQDYFDTFLKYDGSQIPEGLIGELIDGCEFFRKQDPVVFNTDFSGFAANTVGKQLAARLREDLKSSGLRVKLVACVATD